MIRAMLNLLSDTNRKSVAIVLFWVVLMAVLDALGVASVIPFLTVVSDPSVIDSSEIAGAAFKMSCQLGICDETDFILVLGGLNVTAIAVISAARSVAQYMQIKFVQMQQYSISSRLFKIYLRRPYEYYLTNHTADLSKTILSEVGQVISSVLSPALAMLSAVVQAVLIAILLVAMDPWLALIAATLAALIYVIMFTMLRKKATELGRARIEANKERFFLAAETFNLIKQVKALKRESFFADRFDRSAKDFATAQAGFQILNHIPNYIAEAVVFTAVIISILLVVVINGGLQSEALVESLPSLGVYALGAIRLKPSFQAIYSGFIGLRYGRGILEKLATELADETNGRSNFDEVDHAKEVFRHLSVEDISYTYPGSAQQSINSLSFEIEASDIIGIMGKTGSGKSTFVNLIVGLLKSSTGVAKLNGNVVDLDEVSSRLNFDYISQDVFLLDASIKENIAFGVPAAEIDNTRVKEVAEIALLHCTIDEEMPLGYDTIIGEKGVRLSGGQRQRLAIARALYNKPDFLVLDEATSALDITTESAVIANIAGLKQQCAVIMVTHRPSSLSICNRVFFIESGCIAEQKSNPIL